MKRRPRTLRRPPPSKPANRPVNNRSALPVELQNARELHLRAYEAQQVSTVKPAAPSRHPPRRPPPPRERMHDLARPLCAGCGERDRVILAGEAHASGEECSAPWCERCYGYVSSMSPGPRRHLPDF